MEQHKKRRLYTTTTDCTVSQHSTGCTVESSNLLSFPFLCVISAECASAPALYLLLFVPVAERWQTPGLCADDFRVEQKGSSVFLTPLRRQQAEVSVSTGPPVWFCQLPSYRRPAAVAPKQRLLTRKSGSWMDCKKTEWVFPSVSLCLCLDMLGLNYLVFQHDTKVSSFRMCL